MRSAAVACWRTAARWHFTAYALILIWVLACPALDRAAATGLSRRQVADDRLAIRRALFIPTPLPPLRVVRYGTFTPAPGVLAERLTFTTGYGLRVPAILYKPQAEQRLAMPALVVVNGHGADKTSWYSYYTGILYARAGAIVLTYDPIGEGERNDEHQHATGEHDRLIAVPGVAERLGGLMVTDVMEAVQVLAREPGVDPHRIGVLGFSMGSFVAVLAGAVDPQIDALLLTGGGTLDGPGGYWDTSHAVMCQAGPYRALSFLGDRAAVLFALNARRGPTLVWNGTADKVMAIPEHGAAFFADLRKRAVLVNGSDRHMFKFAFEPGAGHRPAWVERPLAEWLDQQLHFVGWSGDGPAGMPVEQIGTWARRVGAPLTKGQQGERSDAGLAALEAGVPGLLPEQLNVLPREQWLVLREQFVYSTWAGRATQQAEQVQERER